MALLQKIHLTNVIELGSKIFIIAFVDIFCRFSYQYLGWLSYLMRPLGIYCMGSLLIMPWNDRKNIVKVMLTAAQILCFRMLEIRNMLSEDNNYYTFYLFKFYVILSAFYFCSLDTMRRYGAYVCWYVMVGLIGNEHSLPLIFVILFSFVCFNLLIPEMSWAIFQIFRADYANVLRRKPLKGHAFNIYFILMFMLILGYSYYNTILSGSGIEYIVSILLSTFGMCCNSMVSTYVLCGLICSISTLLWKCCYFAITGLSDIENEQHLILSYGVSPFVVLTDIVVSDMEPYERGHLVITRLLLLSAQFVVKFVDIIEVATSRIDIIQGNMLTCIRVVCINFIFIFGPSMVIYYLYLQYKWDNLGIFLTISDFITILIYTIYTLCHFILFKYDAVRQNFWDGFDSLVFNIKISVYMCLIFIKTCTVVISLWILLFYCYDWLALIRLIFETFHIFNIGVILQRVFSQKNKIIQFTRNLVDATTDALVEHNDVCSICLQEMRGAKLTPCNHFFHESCLQKWLSTKPICPVCQMHIAI